MIHEHFSDSDWLRLAFEAAAEHSDDPNTQNGAVLVPQVGYVASAANCLPRGIAGSPARLRRPEKYRWIEHAERAAIYAAGKIGTKTDKSVLFCCWFACPDCARAIIEAGVSQVVGHAVVRKATPERWAAAVKTGERMLKEAGVGLRWLNVDLGVEIKFDGGVIRC